MPALLGFADIISTSSKGLLDPPNKKAADSKWNLRLLV
jgi:hypothetical protein